MNDKRSMLTYCQIFPEAELCKLLTELHVGLQCALMSFWTEGLVIWNCQDTAWRFCSVRRLFQK